MFQKTDVPVPSRRTVDEIVIDSKDLANHQCEEKINSCGMFDFHYDGTTKEGEKYFNFAARTDQGELISLGFQTVAREDSETILSKSKEI